MKKHFANAALGALDYAAYPIGMVLVAPVVLRRLGAAEYGLWAISTAVISTGGIVASGFCDANLQRVARLRASVGPAALAVTVRSMFGINLALGLATSILVWTAAPFAATRIAASRPELLGECLICLRIAGLLVAVRAVESVCASTQRAFEAFAGNVLINTAVRILTLAAAATLALAGYRSVSLVTATGIFLTFGAIVQFRQARRLLGGLLLMPAFEPCETRILINYGFFTWLQSIGGALFGQFDRVFVGVTLGAAAAAPYTLCVQLAHPIFGLAASGLQFLFPYLSRRSTIDSKAVLARTLAIVFAINLLLVAIGAMALFLIGNRLIAFWAGSAAAQTAAQILPAMVLSSALMGLSVTGVYALLAFGFARIFAVLGLASKAAAFVIMIGLARHGGLQGVAASRLFYGFLSLLVYVPLWRHLAFGGRHPRLQPALPLNCEFQKVAEP